MISYSILITSLELLIANEMCINNKYKLLQSLRAIFPHAKKLLKFPSSFFIRNQIVPDSELERFRISEINFGHFHEPIQIYPLNKHM